MIKNKSIGVFDSGLGGLTVLKSLCKAMPNEQFTYIGDTAHVPYGNKSKESIIKFATQIIRYLEKKEVKLIIIACNTVSSLGINILKQNTKIPIIDVITPIKHYFKQTRKSIKTIGIIGTDNTIKSQAYEKLIRKIDLNIKVISQACPMLVPIIESGLSQHKIADIMISEYLNPLIKRKIDHLILGCTHYPLLIPRFKKRLPPNVSIIDSAKITAELVDKFLIKNELNTPRSTTQPVQIYVTDKKTNFEKTAKKYFDLPINRIAHISIV